MPQEIGRRRLSPKAAGRRENQWWKQPLTYSDAIGKQAVLTFDAWDHRISLHGSFVRLTKWKSNTDCPFASIVSVAFAPDTCFLNPCGKIGVMMPGGEVSVIFHKDQEPIAKWFRDRIWEQVQVAHQSPARSELTSANMVDELERLGRLHAAGTLDDAEFAAAKKRTMG